MRSRREKILIDLLNIYLKYDADEIAAALQSLQSGEAFRVLVELGHEASKLRRRDPDNSPSRRTLPPRKHASRNGRAPLDELISTLLASENNQHQEIGAVLKAAADREILSSTSLLQKLFLTIGLPVSEHRDRLSMI